MTDIPKNSLCEALGIEIPRLEEVATHLEANTFRLLIVALLENGRPMTLDEVAQRFEDAGIMSTKIARHSLRRCRPGRRPLFRDGDYYELNPRDEDVKYLLQTLDITPIREKARIFSASVPKPLPSINDPLTVEVLDKAWVEFPDSWSCQRIVLCVLDVFHKETSHEKIIEFLSRYLDNPEERIPKNRSWRRNSAVRITRAGNWEIVSGHDALRSAKQAVRDQIEKLNRYPQMSPDEKNKLEARFELSRKVEGNRLRKLRRAIVTFFPSNNPQSAAVLNIEQRLITTYVGDELKQQLPDYLLSFSLLAGTNIRNHLRELGMVPGDRELIDLGCFQKTRKINQQGRTLKIDLSLLIRGTCNISRPFGDPKKMIGYLKQSNDSKIRRRLEADVKSLFAIYQYARLHGGSVRLRWGFIDEVISVPWERGGDEELWWLMDQAVKQSHLLEVVVGTAPGWTNPWARVKTVSVLVGEYHWQKQLIDDDGVEVYREEVQLARLMEAPQHLCLLD